MCNVVSCEARTRCTNPLRGVPLWLRILEFCPMCLHIDFTIHTDVHAHRKPAPLIAGYDILCYKRLRPSRGGRNLWSPVMMALWKPGYRHTTAMRVSDDQVEEGFHAYLNYQYAADNCQIVVEQIFPAIIPMGALFYIGRHGEIVANSMTVYKDDKAALQGRKLGAANLKLHKFASYHR